MYNPVQTYSQIGKSIGSGLINLGKLYRNYKAQENLTKAMQLWDEIYNFNNTEPLPSVSPETEVATNSNLEGPSEPVPNNETLGDKINQFRELFPKLDSHSQAALMSYMREKRAETNESFTKANTLYNRERQKKLDYIKYGSPDERESYGETLKNIENLSSSGKYDEAMDLMADLPDAYHAEAYNIIAKNKALNQPTIYTSPYSKYMYVRKGENYYIKPNPSYIEKEDTNKKLANNLYTNVAKVNAADKYTSDLQREYVMQNNKVARLTEALRLANEGDIGAIEEKFPDVYQTYVMGLDEDKAITSLRKATDKAISEKNKIATLLSKNKNNVKETKEVMFMQIENEAPDGLGPFLAKARVAYTSEPTPDMAQRLAQQYISNWKQNGEDKDDLKWLSSHYFLLTGNPLLMEGTIIKDYNEAEGE